VLLPEAQVQRFIDAALSEVKRLYPNGVSSPDYSAIINDRHYSRIEGYLEDASSKGAQTVVLGGGTSPAARKFAPTIVTGVNDEMRVMQEEIFGPVLPLVGYRDLDEARRYVADQPRPLALYYFDYDGTRIDRMLKETIAGGVTVNDTIFHIAQDDLPFGGVGHSGIGHYHGEEGFNTFSKRKGVFLQSRLNGAGMLKPPFGQRIDRLLNSCCVEVDHANEVSRRGWQSSSGA
jgi:acyl-CoA reductase-like NAD-dependent aldehyde dehydrogenase